MAKFWSVSVGEEPGELWLDSHVLRDMQNASRLEQKVSELFELLRDPIYRYVCRLIGKRAEAEDLTQETFLRLYDSLQKGQAMGNVRPWLYRVAHSLAIDWLRQQGRLEQIEDDVLPFAAPWTPRPMRSNGYWRMNDIDNCVSRCRNCRRNSAIACFCALRVWAIGRSEKYWASGFPQSPPFWGARSNALLRM